MSNSASQPLHEPAPESETPTNFGKNLGPLNFWQFEETRLTWGDRTYLMGVLNLTPDSFSDGGQFNSLATAIAQAHRLAAEGADIIDLGGQSTRPGAATVSIDEELDRVIPVIHLIREGGYGYPPLTTPLSIDTTRATVAREAIVAGVDLVNDISGATADDRMLATVAELAVPIVLMHRRGTPKTMQTLTDYDDVVREVVAWLGDRVAAAEAAGLPPQAIAIDPGLGFAKTASQNLEILRRLGEFRALNRPLLVGPSRKSFIGEILQETDPKKRIWGTGAACAAAIAGGADLLRVHDLQSMRDIARVTDAIYRVGQPT